MDYSYGDIKGIKTLLQINQDEYDNFINDDLLIDCLNLARIDFNSYLIMNCIGEKDFGCEVFFIDNIVNLIALSYVYLMFESNNIVVENPKSKGFTDKAYFLLEQFKNKLLDEECKKGNKIRHYTINQIDQTIKCKR